MNFSLSTLTTEEKNSLQSVNDFLSYFFLSAFFLWTLTVDTIKKWKVEEPIGWGKYYIPNYYKQRDSKFKHGEVLMTQC